MKSKLAFMILWCAFVGWPAWSIAQNGPADDGDPRSLLLALDRQERYLQAHGGATLQVGARRIPKTRIVATIRELRRWTLSSFGTPEFEQALASRFEFLTVSSGALFTAYHTPLLAAGSESNPDFPVPILGRPADLAEKGGKVYRRQGGQQLPAPTRAQIMDGCYDVKKLAIAWTNDPVELYYAQIQGGALLTYPDGRRRTLLFAGTNGYGYVSIEPEITNQVAADKRPGGYFGIRDYLRRNPAAADRFFRLNPRYIFFKLSDEPPMGMAGMSLTAKRSIATDKRFYHAGLLAYVTYPEPSRQPDGSIVTRTVRRIVCDADSGAAIKGPDRVDVYFGEGSATDLFASGLKAKGTLSYFWLR